MLRSTIAIKGLPGLAGLLESGFDIKVMTEEFYRILRFWFTIHSRSIEQAAHSAIWDYCQSTLGPDHLIDEFDFEDNYLHIYMSIRPEYKGNVSMAWKVENAAIRSIRSASQKLAEQMTQERKQVLERTKSAREASIMRADMLVIYCEAPSEMIKIINIIDIPFLPWDGWGTMIATRALGLKAATRDIKHNFHYERWLKRFKEITNMGWVIKELAPAQEDRLPLVGIGRMGGEGIWMDEWKQIGVDEENAASYKLFDGRFVERDVVPGFQSH